MRIVKKCTVALFLIVFFCLSAAASNETTTLRAFSAGDRGTIDTYHDFVPCSISSPSKFRDEDRFSYKSHANRSGIVAEITHSKKPRPHANTRTEIQLYKSANLLFASTGAFRTYANREQIAQRAIEFNNRRGELVKSQMKIPISQRKVLLQEFEASLERTNHAILENVDTYLDATFRPMFALSGLTLASEGEISAMFFRDFIETPEYWVFSYVKSANSVKISGHFNRPGERRCQHFDIDKIRKSGSDNPCLASTDLVAQYNYNNLGVIEFYTIEKNKRSAGDHTVAQCWSYSRQSLSSTREFSAL